MHKTPRQLPPFSTLAHDLAMPAPELAAWLGVSLRTLQRWAADDDAPRAALVAMWLASSWGMSAADSDRQQAAQTALQLADALRRERDALRAEVDRLAPLARAGAANEPVRPAA